MKKLFPLLAGLLLYSCNIINPDEDQPAFLNINSYEVTASAEQGGNTDKITDAWVYVNSEYLGAFTIPAMVPVLAEGEQLVEIFPGVKINGIASIPDIYPFYERHSTIIDFQGGAEIVVEPKASYLSAAIFVMTEQFNDSDHKMQEDFDGDSDTRIIIVTEGSLDGKSARMQLNTEHRLVNIGSIALTEYPQAASAFYLEFDYKTDTPMAVGLVGYNSFGQEVFSNFGRGVNPKAQWNKIYIDLSDVMAELKITPTLAYYRLEFSSYLDPLNQDGLTASEIFLDNVKLLRFQ